MTLAERIKTLIKERNWSQSQLAQAAGLKPSVLSRLLGGDRPWRDEHVAAVAAALSTTPERLVEGTEVTLDAGGALDLEFAQTLTKDHGELVSENARIRADLAEATQVIERQRLDGEKLRQTVADLEFALDRETRARASADEERRALEKQSAALNRDLANAKAALREKDSELQSSRLQLANARAEYAKAAETANRNYAAVTELRKKVSTAEGVAGVAVTGGLISLAMVLGSAANRR